jgi:hypothetical protein
MTPMLPILDGRDVDWVHEKQWAPRALPPYCSAVTFEDNRKRTIQVRLQKWGRVFARCSGSKRVTVYRQLKFLERCLLLEGMLNRYNRNRRTTLWAKRGVGSVQIDLGVISLQEVQPTYCTAKDLERLHERAILEALSDG